MVAYHHGLVERPYRGDRQRAGFSQEPWHLLFWCRSPCDCAGHLQAARADRCNRFLALSYSILRLIKARIMSLQGATRGLAGSKTRDLPAVGVALPLATAIRLIAIGERLAIL